MIDIRNWAKSFHDSMGAVLAYVAPILAPLPSALAILNGSGSIVIAVVVESLGFAAVAIALRTYSHNKRAQPRDRFPLWLPVTMFLIYFATTMLIIVAAETLPAWAQWRHGDLPSWGFVKSIAPVLYPWLTMVGAGVYAFSESLDEVQDAQEVGENYDRTRQEMDLEFERKERELALENERLNAEAKREIARLKIEAKLSQTVPNLSQPVPTRDENETPTRERDSGTARPTDKEGQIWDIIETDPKLSVRQISEMVGMSRSTVNRRLKKAGYSKNGQGWKIYGKEESE